MQLKAQVGALHADLYNRTLEVRDALDELRVQTQEAIDDALNAGEHDRLRAHSTDSASSSSDSRDSSSLTTTERASLSCSP